MESFHAMRYIYIFDLSVVPCQQIEKKASSIFTLENKRH
jgi:hypothetical protein